MPQHVHILHITTRDYTNLHGVNASQHGLHTPFGETEVVVTHIIRECITFLDNKRLVEGRKYNNKLNNNSCEKNRNNERRFNCIE